MTTVFVVTSVVKQEPVGRKGVTLAAYTNKEQAFKVAQDSLTTEGGVLSEWISKRKEVGLKTPLIERIEGNTTMWGIWAEGSDWYTETSFFMATKVEEVEVK